MERNFYDQPIDSDIKRYKETRQLTAGKCEDYTAGCLLDYEYIKNHCKVTVVGLSKHKNQTLIQNQFSKQKLLDD